MNMNRTTMEAGPHPVRRGLKCTCDEPGSPVEGMLAYCSHYCPRHGDAAAVRDAERRANLLAALNDAPTSLVGWPELVERRPRRWVLTLNGPAPVPGRWARLDAMQFQVAVNRAARAVAETVGGVMRALAPTYRRGSTTNYGAQTDYALAPDNRK